MTRSTSTPNDSTQIGVHASALPLSEQLVEILPRLRRHVGARHSHGNSEDIVQEALLRALQSSESFRPTEDPWPWIRTIADRVAIRRSQRERLAPGSLDETELEPAARTDDPGDNVESARALIARLQGPERQALERFYLDGMSVAEIATAESSPRGTIKARLSRGRGRLMLFAAATMGIALAVFFSVRGKENPDSTSEPSTATLHYASITIEHIPVYEPKLQTIDLTPKTFIGWQVSTSH